MEKSVKKYSTFALLFYINKAKAKKNGLCTVMGRISVNAEIAQFSTQIEIDPQLWDAKSYRLTGRSKDAVQANRKLDKLTEIVSLHYREMVEEQGYVTAELVKNRVMGIGSKRERLLELFTEHNEEYARKVGVTRTVGGYKHYLMVYNHIAAFIRLEYKAEDILLKQLTYSFIEKFDFYLRIEKHHAESTVGGYMIILKKMIRRAIHQGILLRDPFASYVPAQPPKKCRHMTADELERFMTTKIASKSLRHTRDMFVFGTFTGLSYADLCSLSTEHISGRGDSQWIHLKRQKTGSECHVKLLDIPRQIIEKYKSERKSNKIFNMVGYASLHSNLKKVVKLCGIERNTTFHQSRHNFGTLITLSQGVPLETVSRMMGHLGVKTTQIYAKLTNQKINEDMKLLTERMGNKYDRMYDNTQPLAKINNKPSKNPKQ